MHFQAQESTLYPIHDTFAFTHLSSLAWVKAFTKSIKYRYGLHGAHRRVGGASFGVRVTVQGDQYYNQRQERTAEQESFPRVP